MTSDEYYAAMIGIEKAKFEEMKRHNQDVETTKRLKLAELKRHDREMERISISGFRHSRPPCDQILQYPVNS